MQARVVTQESWRRAVVPTLALVGLAALVALGLATVGAVAVAPIFGIVLVALIVVRPEYGIVFFLSTFLMAYPRWLQGSGYLTLNNVLGAVFALLLIYKIYRDHDWSLLRCRELQLLAFIVLTYYVSERINGPDPRDLAFLGPGFYFAEGLRLFVNRVVFTMFLIAFIRTPGHIRMIYLVTIAFMVITSFTALQTAVFGEGVGGYRAFVGAAERVAVRGQLGIIRVAVNPNRVALFAILAFAGLWYVSQVQRRPVVRFAIIPVVVLLALTVFTTASRSGLLGLGVCVLVILVDRGFGARRLLALGLATALLLSLVNRFVSEQSLERITNLPGTERASTGEGAGSLRRRRSATEAALEIVRQSPFLGVGRGNWAIVRFLNDPTRSTASAHNSYLAAMVEGGILCLAGFLALLWRTWQNLQIAEAYLRGSNSPVAEIAWIVKGAKASLLVLVFFSVFANLWQLVILFWLVGLSVVIRRVAEHGEGHTALA